MSIQNGYSILGLGNPFYDRSVFVMDDFLKLQNLDKGVATITKDPFAVKKTWESAKPKNDGYWSLGGSGTNVIKTLAHLGHRCAIYGKIGEDDVGKKIEERLNNLGVTSLLSKGKGGTGTVNCFITPDSQRTMHTFLGATVEFSDDEILEERFHNIKHCHIEGYACYYGNTIEKTIEFAKKNHATTSLDLASPNVVTQFKCKFKNSIDQFDYVFGNLEEFKALTEIDSIHESISCFKSTQTVIATDGAEGCWVKQSGNSIAIGYKALDVANIVDTTGAGDFFEAGFLHGALLNNDVSKCVKMGNLAASFVIQEIGAELPNDKWGSLVNIISKM